MCASVNSEHRCSRARALVKGRSNPDERRGLSAGSSFQPNSRGGSQFRHGGSVRDRCRERAEFEQLQNQVERHKDPRHGAPLLVYDEPQRLLTQSRPMVSARPNPAHTPTNSRVTAHRQCRRTATPNDVSECPGAGDAHSLDPRRRCPIAHSNRTCRDPARVDVGPPQRDRQIGYPLPGRYRLTRASTRFSTRSMA